MALSDCAGAVEAEWPRFAGGDAAPRARGHCGCPCAKCSQGHGSPTSSPSPAGHW